MATILSHYHNAVQILTISHENKRNAFTHQMTQQLGELLQAAENDIAVKCVVITGAGDIAFSSGHDLREILEDRDNASEQSANLPFLMPVEMKTPTIAAINGFAYAAGFILSISCDLRICSENASFSAPGARIGLLPIGGQLSRLPMLMPRGIAHEMLISSREMRADEAYRVGFANRVVPRGEALLASLSLAGAIAANSSAVIRSIKTGLEIFSRKGITAAADYEWSTSRKLQNAPDADEGMRAFMEKRNPRFA
jgi:enoyl-CoA hydratase/carnithine racemase